MEVMGEKIRVNHCAESVFDTRNAARQIFHKQTMTALTSIKQEGNANVTTTN